MSLSSHFTENCFSARIRSDLCLQGPVFRSRACAKVEGLYMLGPGMQMAPDPGDGSANEHTAPTGPRSGEFCPASRTGLHQPSCPLGVTQQSLRGTSWYLSSSSRDLVSGIIELQLTTLCRFSFAASQCNVSLKKQRSRSILSSFFCCFRDYNVEAPPGSSPGVLPPLVEENGGLQKVSADAQLPPRGLCPILDEHP